MIGFFFLLKASLGLFVFFFVYLVVNFLYLAPKRYEEFYLKQGIGSPGYKLLVGNSPDLRAAAQADTPFAFYRQLSHKYGKVFQMFLGPFHRLTCLSPSLLQEVFVRKAHFYIKTRSIATVFRPLLGNGLVLSEGDIWKSQRSYINPAFHFKNIKEMIGLMCDCTQRTVPKWVPADKTGLPFEMECHFAFSSLTLDVIAATAFGSSFRDLPNASNIVYHAFVECLDTLQARMFASIAFLPFIRDLPIAGKPKVDKGVADIQGLVNHILELRRTGANKPLGGGKDLLQLLLDARDADGKPMDETLLKDELKTFVLAGHETTSNLLSWMAYRLCLHPEMQQKCAEEVVQVLPNLAIPDYDKLKRLHYLDAFMDETLRCHPPVATLSREALVDHVISGVKEDGSKWDVEIKAGTIIGLHVPTLHMDPSIWPEPEKFDPIRFLARPVAGTPTAAGENEEEEAMQKPRHAPCAFMPFSAGPRTCIGAQFAKLEAKVIMAAILQRFSLELTAGQKIVPNVALTIRPKYGLTVRFTPRLTNAA